MTEAAPAPKRRADRYLRRQSTKTGPVYAYCESAWASASAHWHIRHLTSRGMLPGGGVDTDALCGLNLRGGWDIGGVTVTKMNVEMCGDCQKCAEQFLAELHVGTEPPT